MAGYVFEIVLGGNCKRSFDRPIKPDANARATDEHEKSRTHLAMHVDHQIVLRAANLFEQIDRKSTRLNSSHSQISYAVFCLKKKNKKRKATHSECTQNKNA